jgi:integrase
MHFRVQGKGGKTRYIPVHPQTTERINDYLGRAGHGADLEGAVFRAVRRTRDGNADKALSGHGVYKDVVKKYARLIGIEEAAVSVHGMRATAATNALEHEADIAKVQEWLGHASISTTRLYDRRRMRAEDSPTFKISY